MDDPRRWKMEHELNTVLTVLRLRVQMLQRHSASDPPRRQRLGEILDSVDELQKVYARILSRMGGDGSTSDASEQVGGAGITAKVHTPHIAVVNDDTAFLRLMDELLGQEEGYKVSTSFVGSEAYAFVRDLQPDLVVLDLVFGSGAEEGWRTLDLLTLDPVTRRIPVIVCSAATVQLQDHADWLRRFDVEVLPKPFDLDTLLDMVRAALGMPRRGFPRSDR